MKKKEDYLKKIRINYRIESSKELQAFWTAVKKQKLYDQHIPFRFFKIKLFTLEQVAEYDYQKARFWFKKRGEYFLVRYYIPLATTYTFGNTLFIAGYDSAKRFIGIFLTNLNQDPIFITSDLSSLLSNVPPALSKEDFLKKEVSGAVIKSLDYEEIFVDEEGEDKPELFIERMTSILKFVQIMFNSVGFDYEFKIKTLKKSFKINFIHKTNPKHQAVKHEIEIPKIDTFYNGVNIIIPALNRINLQLWSSYSNTQKEYGFYRLDNGIALLHIHQVCEFIRLGAIPYFNNVHFPPIIYSTHPSGYINALEYEVVLFETQEEYSAYYKAFHVESEKLSIRRLEEKDIPRIVDYFMDASKNQLETNGFDKMKIPFEEKLIKNLQLAMTAEDVKKKQFNIMLEKGGNTYGHCYIERFHKKGEAYFYLYDWNGLLRRDEVIDGLIKLSVQRILQTYPLKTLYAEPTKEDNFRNEVYKRAGFEFVKEHQNIRDSLSSKTTFNLWRLDCEAFGKLNP